MALSVSEQFTVVVVQAVFYCDNVILTPWNLVFFVSYLDVAWNVDDDRVFVYMCSE